MADAANLENLNCPLCLDLFVEPVTLVCQHSYCKSCLISTIKNDKSCPICRKRFLTNADEIRMMSSNPIIKALVEQQQQNGVCNSCNKHKKLFDCGHCRKRLCVDCKTIHKPTLFSEVEEIVGVMQCLRMDGLTEIGKKSDEITVLLSEKEKEMRKIEANYSVKESKMNEDVNELRLDMIKWKNIEAKAKAFLDNWSITSHDIISKFKNEIDSIHPLTVKESDTVEPKTPPTSNASNEHIETVIVPFVLCSSVPGQPKVEVNNALRSSTSKPQEQGANFNSFFDSFKLSGPRNYSEIVRPVKIIKLSHSIQQMVATPSNVFGIQPNNKSILRISNGDYVIRESTSIHNAKLTRGLAVSANGTFVVSDHQCNRIVTVNQNRWTSDFFEVSSDGKIQLNEPRGIFMKGNIIAIADELNDRIVIINTSGKYIQNFGKRYLFRPRDVYISSDNSYFVVDRNGLSKFGKNGNLITSVDLEGDMDKNGSFIGATGVACDHFGDILVLHSLSRSVRVVDSSDLSLKHIFGDNVIRTASGLCVLDNGRVAVSNWYEKELLIF